MALKRGREIELSVEREVVDATGIPRRLRLAARFALDDASTSPSASELASAIRKLDRELDEARVEAGFRGPSPRSERSRTELLETYRPRQAELIDALLADGEITEGEAQILRAALPTNLPAVPAARPAPRPAPRPVPAFSETDRPLAALPLSNDRSPSIPRPVPELLATFQISSLKQAGAIRARRQISYDEYMALKRHFGGSEPSPTSSS